MNGLQSIHVMRQMAREHEASLRPVALGGLPVKGRRELRRWVGRQLVRTGCWLAYERPIGVAAAR